MTIAERLMSRNLNKELLIQTCKHHPDLMGSIRNVSGTYQDYSFSDKSKIVIEIDKCFSK